MVASTLFEKSSSAKKRVPIFDQKTMVKNNLTGQIIFNRELRQQKLHTQGGGGSALKPTGA